MAKELPYFKFEPNQWENGNIQICDRELKGLFIDLCSMYWSRLGDLPFKLAVQKLCGGNATALNSLCDYKIITVEEEFICIEFLEEQLLEFGNISKKNSQNAKDGWRKRREIKELCENDATALNSLCEIDAIREDKIREDKIREYKIPTKVVFDFEKNLIEYGFEKNLIVEWLSIRKKKKAVNSETAFNGFIKEIEKCKDDKNEILKYIITKSWQGFEAKWLDNSSYKKTEQKGINHNTSVNNF